MRSYLEVHPLCEAAGTVGAAEGALAGAGSPMGDEVVRLGKHLIASRDVTGEPLPLCLPTWQLLCIPPFVLLLCLSWLRLDLQGRDSQVV